ncbi:hypothetical protein V6N12_003555 [Hibiscus sabdariffa]|uniref:Uncharacterized protein n=1 Tax=Hibiscus sabdariffa TaxID=183260 RepID=A0ABR2B346_9ROSI
MVGGKYLHFFLLALLATEAAADFPQSKGTMTFCSRASGVFLRFRSETIEIRFVPGQHDYDDFQTRMISPLQGVVQDGWWDNSKCLALPTPSGIPCLNTWLKFSVVGLVSSVQSVCGGVLISRSGGL